MAVSRGLTLSRRCHIVLEPALPTRVMALPQFQPHVISHSGPHAFCGQIRLESLAAKKPLPCPLHCHVTDPGYPPHHQAD